MKKDKEYYKYLVRSIETNEFCDMCIEQEAYELERSCTDCPIKKYIKQHQ